MKQLLFICFLSLCSLNFLRASSPFATEVNSNLEDLNCGVSFTITHTGSNTFDFYANGSGVVPFTYAWDFGDGTTGTGATPTHTYAPGNGNYTACVTITTGIGCTKTVCQTISIPSTSCDFYLVSNQWANMTHAFEARDTIRGDNIRPFTFTWDY